MPVSNLAGIREAGHRYADVEITNTEMTLDELSNQALELNIQFEVQDAEAFGIGVFQENDKGTSITYLTNEQQLIFNRANSGDVSFSESFIGSDTVAIPLEDGMLNLRIFLDHSLVEIFAQNGKYCISNQVFPEKQSGVSWFSKNGTVTVKKAEAWKLRSTWKQPD